MPLSIHENRQTFAPSLEMTAWDTFVHAPTLGQSIREQEHASKASAKANRAKPRSHARYLLPAGSFLAEWRECQSCIHTDNKSSSSDSRTNSSLRLIGPVRCINTYCFRCLSAQANPTILVHLQLVLRQVFADLRTLRKRTLVLGHASPAAASRKMLPFSPIHQTPAD